MTTVRNLTPHAVTLVGQDRSVRLFPHGAVPRVAEKPERSSAIMVDQLHVPLHDIRVGSVFDLPDPEDDVVLMVPRVVAAACPGRADLVVPFDEVRDSAGRVIGCRALARLLPLER